MVLLGLWRITGLPTPLVNISKPVQISDSIYDGFLPLQPGVVLAYSREPLPGRERSLLFCDSVPTNWSATRAHLLIDDN